MMCKGMTNADRQYKAAQLKASERQIIHFNKTSMDLSMVLLWQPLHGCAEEQI